jgi:hypothetical protein
VSITPTGPVPSLGLVTVDAQPVSAATAAQTGFRPALALTASDTVIGTETPADPPPTGVREEVLQRVSEVFPAPTLANGVPVQPWRPSSVTRADLGVLHVFVDGIDRTYVRGARTEVVDYELMDPFGSGSPRSPRGTPWAPARSGGCTPAPPST